MRLGNTIGGITIGLVGVGFIGACVLICTAPVSTLVEVVGATVCLVPIGLLLIRCGWGIVFSGGGEA